MTVIRLEAVDTSKYAPRIEPLDSVAFGPGPDLHEPVPLRESILVITIASCFAGGVKGPNFHETARKTLREGSPEDLRRSAWSQIIPCLRTNEWLRLIKDEGLSWRRAATILRAINLDFGWLAGPVNDQATDHQVVPEAKTRTKKRNIGPTDGRTKEPLLDKADQDRNRAVREIR